MRLIGSVGLHRYIHLLTGPFRKGRSKRRGIINIYDERTQDSYANYLEHKDRIESKIAAARENLDKYTYQGSADRLNSDTAQISQLL